jgi:hypothetical protein
MFKTINTPSLLYTHSLWKTPWLGSEKPGAGPLLGHRFRVNPQKPVAATGLEDLPPVLKTGVLKGTVGSNPTPSV